MMSENEKKFDEIVTWFSSPERASPFCAVDPAVVNTRYIKACFRRKILFLLFFVLVAILYNFFIFVTDARDK